MPDLTTEDRRRMLTRACVVAPDIESHKITARVRVNFDDDNGLVVFSAVRGDYLVAVTAVEYRDFELIDNDTTMKGVYAVVLEELTREMDEAWDDGTFPIWIEE